MFKLADRVKETSITTGSGQYITLTGAFGSFQTFLDGIGDGNSTYYTIENNANFEVGIGTYSAATNSFSRDNILASSNDNQRIDLLGVSIVFCSYPASKAFVLNSQGLATGPDGSFVGIQFPDGSIQTQGTAQINSNRSYRTITNSQNITNSDDIVLVDCSLSNIQATLPYATSMSGKTVTFKLKNGPNILTISTQSEELIDSLPSFSIHHKNMSISVFSDSFNWYIL
jgi:hypothetical protein